MHLGGQTAGGHTGYGTRQDEGAIPVSGKILSILNDPPYGTERSYNGLRLAGAWPNAATARYGCS
jgi:hypothetical protein